VEKSLHRYTKAAKSGNDKEAAKLVAVLEKCQAALNQGKPVRALDFSKEEEWAPAQAVVPDHRQAGHVRRQREPKTAFENNPFLDRLKEYAAAQNAPVVAICAKIEAEMADMSDEDRDMFLAEMGQDEPA
jgi:ribosome-binding ATPase YchF (GTP1/OBG family)